MYPLNKLQKLIFPELHFLIDSLLIMTRNLWHYLRHNLRPLYQKSLHCTWSLICYIILHVILYYMLYYTIWQTLSPSLMSHCCAAHARLTTVEISTPDSSLRPCSLDGAASRCCVHSWHSWHGRCQDTPAPLLVIPGSSSHALISSAWFINMYLVYW